MLDSELCDQIQYLFKFDFFPHFPVLRSTTIHILNIYIYLLLKK